VTSCILNSCDQISGFTSGAKDPIVAKVGSKSLFLSQIEGMVADGSSMADSMAIVDGYIQNWIRENLMVIEAENNIAADINLTKLVDDYRSSLLVYNFEKRLVDEKLDTIVANSEKMEYYEMNNSQYLLSHSIVKCILAKVSSKNKNLSNIKKALVKSDLTEALFLIKENADYHHIDVDKWLSKEDVRSLVPTGLLDDNDFKSGKVKEKKVDDFQYFVKIIEMYDEKQIPPFDFIESKITKSILIARKNKILTQYRTELYQKGAENGAFEIFNN